MLLLAQLKLALLGGVQARTGGEACDHLVESVQELGCLRVLQSVCCNSRDVRFVYAQLSVDSLDSHTMLSMLLMEQHQLSIETAPSLGGCRGSC